ncbi:NEDD8 protease nep2 [Homalodisca vitripennis]|nr:NEDD8 protease nep2 [Homalodisca vitripennis]
MVNPYLLFPGIPAAILQQPFFSARVPQYVNYATIGVAIGHEITHGFDDVGSQFDYKGDLNDWWETESKKNFNEKKMCIIDQYGSYKDSQTQLNSKKRLYKVFAKYKKMFVHEDKKKQNLLK